MAIRCTVALLYYCHHLLYSLVLECELFSSQGTAASMLSITHAPNYVSFLKDAGPIPSNEISSVNTLALGFSIPKV